ncbi:hypothetical protein [Actinocorallia aurantiaca]|uniref:TetR family transcriptional regulator n=1 Tax=Actinocorallia aurantiaca TaxID=46204 RepID=A0ABN3UQ57_9ACTN
MLKDRVADADERVLETSARLFAELGYDATDLDMIISAAGPEASRSKLLREGKAGLYRAVFERFRGLEESYFKAVAEEMTHDAEGMHRLADASLDFAIDYPEVNAVWEHRALKDAIDLDFPERFVPALESVITSSPWEGLRQDVDLRFLSWTMIWMVMGFTGTGLPYEEGHRRRADHGPTLDYFRARLHEMIDCRIRP